MSLSTSRRHFLRDAGAMAGGLVALAAAAERKDKHRVYFDPLLSG